MPRRATQDSSSQALITALGVALCLATTSCGKIADSGPRLPQAPLAPAVEVAVKVSVLGKITLQGIQPASLRQIVDVGGNPFCTGHGEILDPAWRVSADGGLANVVVTVQGSPRASNIIPDSAPRIDQTRCEFVPNTLAVQPGQLVRFRNSDLTFHNIRIARHQAGTSHGGENLANLAQASQGLENEETFSVPGIYRLECDVHRWMKAWIYVHEGIHTAVSAADGTYRIDRALADGDYTLKAWHPCFAEPLSQQITISKGTAKADFAFAYSKAFQL
jgi:plastocyanin